MGSSEIPDPDQNHLEGELEEIVAGVLASDDPEGAVGAACAAHPLLASRIRRSLDELRRMRLLVEPAALPGVLESVGGFRLSVGGFRLTEVLGRGGMGVVYRAVDAELGREVPLKVLRPELLHFADSRRRFQREIESVSRLRQPGIVSVYSAGEDAGVPFFTMELVDGVPLSRTTRRCAARRSARGADLLGPDHRRRDSSTSYPQPSDNWTDACLQVGRMIAEALQHAHEQGVYHRDVKPPITFSSAGRSARVRQVPCCGPGGSRGATPRPRSAPFSECSSSWRASWRWPPRCAAGRSNGTPCGISSTRT